MTSEQIDKAFAKTESETSEKANEHLFSFIKQILVLTTTLLGLLISFSDKNPESQIEIVFFIITLILLGFCILLGLAILYERPQNYAVLRTKIWEHKQSLLTSNQQSESTIFAPFSKLFSTKAKIYYASFASSIVALILYGSFALQSDFKSNQRTKENDYKMDLLIEKIEKLEHKIKLTESDTTKADIKK